LREIEAAGPTITGRCGGIIPCVMALRLLHGARGAADGVAGAARHLAWYLSYCLDGSSTRAVDPAEASEPGALGGRVG